MRIGLTGLALAAALAATPASAENWRAASSGAGAVAYIDVDSIRRDGGKAVFWRELRWPEPRSFSNGVRYDRMAALYEADCAAKTLKSKVVRVSLGDKILVQGDGDGEVQTAAPGTTAEVDLHAACFDEWPAGSGSGGSKP